jgi:uncharacterized protein (DUF342 family)
MPINRRNSKALGAAISVLLAGVLIAGGAMAVTSPDQTREGYVAQVEPICKSNTKTNERLLGGVKKQVKEGKLKAAAGKVSAATTSSANTLKKLKQVPQPPADAAKLKQWFGFLEKEQKLLSELSKVLKAENKSRVQLLTIQLTHNGNQANTTVLGFEFNYCLIPTSQFS